MGTAPVGRASEGRDPEQTVELLKGSLAGCSQVLVDKAPLALGCRLEGAHQTLVEGVHTRWCEGGLFHPHPGTHFDPASWPRTQSVDNLDGNNRGVQLSLVQKFPNTK